MKARLLENTTPEIEERSATVKIGGEEYEMLLNTAATIAITKRYGGLDKLGESLSDGMLEKLEDYIWLITTLCNQSVAIHNLWHPEAPVEKLTEEKVQLLALPYEYPAFSEAIQTAITKGVGRSIRSESEDNETETKNTPAG